MKRGIFPVAGCDEAGRGPLAGPVVAACVVVREPLMLRGLNDSKAVLPHVREELAETVQPLLEQLHNRFVCAVARRDACAARRDDGVHSADLPEHDLYIELTTMKQSLVTPKNRKVRMLREIYPDVNVRLLYRKDYQQLLAKAGYGAVEVQNLRKQDIGNILISPVELETRVRALARKISRDYRGQSIVLVGILKGVTFFLADLARQIKVPFVIDYLDLKRYAGAQPRERVRIARDIDYPIEGRHVVLVEDIVNTGLTLDYLLSELRERGPASIDIVTLLDRPGRRLVEVPVRYVGFQIPNDYVVGYGLDYRELYRNLPFICALKPSVIELDTAPNAEEAT